MKHDRRGVLKYRGKDSNPSFTVNREWKLDEKNLFQYSDEIVASKAVLIKTKSHRP